MFKKIMDFFFGGEVGIWLFVIVFVVIWMWGGMFLFLHVIPGFVARHSSEKQHLAQTNARVAEMQQCEEAGLGEPAWVVCNDWEPNISTSKRCFACVDGEGDIQKITPPKCNTSNVSGDCFFELICPSRKKSEVGRHEKNDQNDQT